MTSLKHISVVVFNTMIMHFFYISPKFYDLWLKKLPPPLTEPPSKINIFWLSTLLNRVFLKFLIPSLEGWGEVHVMNHENYILYYFYINRPEVLKLDMQNQAFINLNFLCMRFGAYKTVLGACLCMLEIVHVKEQTCTLLIMTWYSGRNCVN